MFVPGRPFQPKQGQDSALEWSPKKVIQSGRLRPYSVTLDGLESFAMGQTL